MIIKWGAQVPTGEAVIGQVLAGLIDVLVFYKADRAGYLVKFRGPDGVSQELPRAFNDIRKAKLAAEDQLRTMLLLALGFNTDQSFIYLSLSTGTDGVIALPYDKYSPQNYWKDEIEDNFKLRFSDLVETVLSQEKDIRDTRIGGK